MTTRNQPLKTRNQSQDQRLDDIAYWVKDMCLLFEAEPHTAYTVAGLFVKGLAKEWEKNKRVDGS